MHGTGGPEVVQVADRGHLVDHLTDVLEAFPRSQGTTLNAAAAALAGQTEESDQARAPPDAVYQGKRRHPKPALCRARTEAPVEERLARRRANDEAVRALHATGAGVTEITRTVGVAKMTVNRYLREGPPQRKRHPVHGQPRVIESWEPDLLRRGEEGCRMATRLWREIQAQGFTSSLTNVPRSVYQVRPEGTSGVGQRPTSPLTKVQGPTPRHAAAIVRQRPERRTDEQRAYLTHPRVYDPAIATTVDLATDFLVMLRRPEGERWDSWWDGAAASGIGDLARCARKPREELAAVQAGLTLRHRNGQTTGHVNRLKLIKRQGCGRANFDLLSKRVLWTT